MGRADANSAGVAAVQARVSPAARSSLEPVQPAGPGSATPAVLSAACLAAIHAMGKMACSGSLSSACSSVALAPESLAPPTREAAVSPRGFRHRSARSYGNQLGSVIAPGASLAEDALSPPAVPVPAVGLALVRSLFVRPVFARLGFVRPRFVQPVFVQSSEAKELASAPPPLNGS